MRDARFLPSRHDKAWDALIEARRSMDRARPGGVGWPVFRVSQERFNAMLDMYCLLRGEDAETVFERIQEVLIAQHEIRMSQE